MKKKTTRMLSNTTYVCAPTGFKKKGIDWDEAGVIINFMKNVCTGPIYKCYTRFEVHIDKAELDRRGYMYWSSYEIKWGLVIACTRPLADHHVAILKDLGYTIANRLPDGKHKPNWKKL